LLFSFEDGLDCSGQGFGSFVQLENQLFVQAGKGVKALNQLCTGVNAAIDFLNGVSGRQKQLGMGFHSLSKKVKHFSILYMNFCMGSRAFLLAPKGSGSGKAHKGTHDGVAASHCGFLGCGGSYGPVRVFGH
jgi:hypothetical protein